MRILRPTAVFLLFLLLFASRAEAQTVPATAEPSRVQNQIAPMTASASDLVMLAVLAAGDAHARLQREEARI